MSGPLVGATLAAVVAGGGVLAVHGARHSRMVRIESRITPWIRDVVPAPTPVVGWRAFVGQLFSNVARRCGEWISSAASVRRRLVRLGEVETVESFRTRQSTSALIGFTVALMAAMFLWYLTGGHVVGLAILCGFGLVGGAWWVDLELSRNVAAHERLLREVFPPTAELIALAVAAGEGPVAALERVSKIVSGPMAAELDRVLSDVRAGVPVGAALQAWSLRTGVTPIARFADGLAVALERGTPLVDLLHSQASDVRESGRRELIESGGRREIAMMIPVVFIQLPVVLVFAFFPGLVALHFTTGA
jgi:tight adherence protein C